MITCEGCQYDFGPQDLILGFCRDCVIDQHADKIGRLQAELAVLRTDRDELRRVLDKMLIAWGTGELACDVINGRWWPALEDAKKLLESK